MKCHLLNFEGFAFESFWVQLTENIVCRAPQCWSGFPENSGKLSAGLGIQFPFETVSPLVSQAHLIQTKFCFLSSPVSLFFHPLAFAEVLANTS